MNNPGMQNSFSIDNELRDKPLITVKNLGICYYSDKGKRDDFKSHIHKIIKRKNKVEPFWAIKDISFESYSGDILGVIGTNGAGKSTLCRVISGLLRPNRGSIDVQGEVSALLSLGTGFNNELSGNDNVFLNGMMLGLSRRRMRELLPAIRDFSGLGDFMDQPLKYYSSGMKGRLGFSIASFIEADILVLDEILGTGDLEFKDRAIAKMWEIVNAAKLVVVVTHSTGFVRDHCNKALWIEKGEVKDSGDPDKVIDAYESFAADKIKTGNKKKRIVNIKKTNVEKGKENAIEVENLGIKFKLNNKPFWALKDVSFSVKEREIVGIIGPNGAGKSTLCRALCGIYRGDTGSVKINGDIAALLSFGTGFNGQLSGYDNIYLNGLMLGLPRKFIKDAEEGIIEFSGLEEAIYKPVKEYSSGMKSRLGFSIASMLQPDVFVVDEALNAGDITFREKATARMQEMLTEAKAVIIVTHSMRIVENACTRVLFLKKGELVFDGDPKEAVALYTASAQKKQTFSTVMPERNSPC